MATKQLWQWRGLTRQGEAITGTIWAENRAMALLITQQNDVIPLNIKRCPVRKSLWKGPYCCEMVQQLATLLEAGLTLSDSLNLLAEQHAHPQWQALLRHLSSQLAEGESLSIALSQWPDVFPPLYLAMIHAGEITGKLDYCCTHLARQQEAQRLLGQKVKKALFYPIIILSLALLVVIGMCGFVLPEFAEIYRTFNTPLPALTRSVIMLSRVILEGWLLIITVLLLPFMLTPLLQRSTGWQMFRPRILLALPVISALIRGQKLSQIYTVLSLTQNAGLPFLQGVNCVEETLTCPWWRNLVHQIASAVTQGSTIWQALKISPVFTPLCMQLIRTGETSGALDKMLENLASYHSQQTHQKAENLATLLEPAMLLITGVIIGTLVVAMYLPVFNLGDAISGAG